MFLLYRLVFAKIVINCKLSELIEEFLAVCRRFVTLCFEPFSLQVAHRGVYENVILREEHDILHSLHEQLGK